MKELAFNADIAVVDAIDAGELHPMYHQVVRNLCNSIEFSRSDDLVLLTLFDQGLPFDREQWASQYWSRISDLGPETDEIPRLIWCLILEDQEIDWFGAEMLIHWARRAGVAENEIGLAFGLDPSGAT